MPTDDGADTYLVEVRLPDVRSANTLAEELAHLDPDQTVTDAGIFMRFRVRAHSPAEAEHYVGRRVGLRYPVYVVGRWPRSETIDLTDDPVSRGPCPDS
jgi:hypothetical protein